MSSDHKEIEIKLRLPDVEEGLQRLTQICYSVRKERYFESNIIYDRDDGELRRAGLVLRVRATGDGGGLLTFKGKAEDSRHKVREELEITTSDAETTKRILEHLGFSPRFRYEKYRTEFVRAGEPGLILLDETPIGCYLELEGPAKWIDLTAKELGFSKSDYILESYGALQIKFCKLHGKSLGHMLFSSMA
ncbi:MAG: class IV adenylate cyclase [Bryobacteraceae bacterium]